MTVSQETAATAPGKRRRTANHPPLLSMVMTVYRGAQFLDDTFERLMAFEKELPDNTAIEIIAVDDGSPDNSYAKILDNQKRYPGKIRAVRLSRNFGAPAACHAGLTLVRGDCVCQIAQDLQEPPELLLRMFNSWRDGVKVNIPHRKSRDEPLLKKILANTYHFLFSQLVMPRYPKGGISGYLVDRQVADEMVRYQENVEPATQALSMGYSCLLHPYHRPPPVKGEKSNWTFWKSIRLVIDNFISFSYLPVRLMSAVGLVVAVASFLFALYVLIGKLTNWYLIDQPPGWATIVVLVSFLMGLMMIMLGVVGEYLWRILEASRRRPFYLIDEVSDGEK